MTPSPEGPHGRSGDSARTVCSRAGCRSVATTRITWRNPRIHASSRSKVWLACDEHVGVLRDFLAARAFPLEVAPLQPIA